MVLAFRAFFVIGPLFAVWAVVLAAMGFTRPSFPDRIGGQRVVIAISAALFLAVILSAMINAKWEHPEQAKSGPAAHQSRGKGE